MGTIVLFASIEASHCYFQLEIMTTSTLSSLILVYLTVITCVNSECTVKEVASNRFKKCQFPFVFFDKTYYGCIKLIDIRNGVEQYTSKAWCSTKVDGNTREHIGGGSYYGDCPSNRESAEEAAANLQSANQKSSGSQQTSNKNSGLWKPNSDNEECGTRISLSNIVGGTTAKRGDYPFIALLGYDPQQVSGSDIFYTCGGSLINKHYILTAAHCIETGNGRPVEVVLGEHRVDTDPDCSRDGKCSPPKITRGIKEIIMHEGYDEDSNYKHDIALIRLDQEVTLNSEDAKNSWVLPVCLPWAKDSFYRDQVPDGEEATVAGWGRTVRKASSSSTRRLIRNKVNVKVLQSLKVPIANGKCGPGAPIEIDTRRQICAGGEKGKDSCNGDSGGPLIYREYPDEPWHQIGLVSFGTSVCGGGVPGVYTRVAEYMDWIESKLRP